MREEIFKDCLEYWENSEGNKPFWSMLARKWKYKNGETLRLAFKDERGKRGVSKKSKTIDYRETFTKNSDGSYGSDKLIEICEADLKDDRFLLEAHGFDPDKWLITFAKNNLWHALRKDDAGRVIQYQSKITVKPKTINDISFEDITEMFSKKESIAPFIQKKISYKPSDDVLEIDVADLHFGSDANHRPEERFELAVNDILDRIGDRKFDRIYLPLLGDIFHYDTYNKTTTSGTVVTTDGLSPFEIFDLGIDSFVKVIGKLTEIAPVEVLYVAANHDRLSGYHLVKLLEAFFKDNKNVAIDSNHSPRKFRVIGNSLVGWMHGDIPKARASNWLQVEARDEWGKTKYSEIHSGNYHSQSGKEEGGTILRYLPALTNIDAWHNNSGYIGAVRSMVSFVWHKELGLREIWYSNV